MADDYAVGYGKPPRQTQWPSGQSGNPKGRPKVDPASLVAEAARILSEPVTAKTADGKSVQLGALEAAYLAMCMKALKGNDAALIQAIKMMLEIVPTGEQKQSQRAASAAGAKLKLWKMAGLPEEEYKDS